MWTMLPARRRPRIVGDVMPKIDTSSSDSAAHKRAVNDVILASADPNFPDDLVAFFCECPSPRCFETVEMTPLDYARHRRDEQWSALAPGH
jgi:hypothetical protein